MSSIVEPPVQQALTNLRAISADDEVRRLATARERALSIERTEFHLAHQEGRADGEAIGQARGEAIGQARGREEGRAEGEAVGEARGRSEGRAEAIREILDAMAEGNITEVELRKKLEVDSP